MPNNAEKKAFCAGLCRCLKQANQKRKPFYSFFFVAPSWLLHQPHAVHSFVQRKLKPAAQVCALCLIFEKIYAPMKKLYIVFFLAALFSSCGNQQQRGQSDRPGRGDTSKIGKIVRMQYELPLDSFKVFYGNIQSNQFLADILTPYHVPYVKIDQLARCCDSVFDIRHIRAGNPYAVFCTRDTPHVAQYFVYEHNPVDYIVFSFDDPVHIEKKRKQTRMVREVATGEIETSLWNAMVANGYNPLLANELSDVYAWSIDFFGLAKGDQFKVVYDVLYVDSLAIGIENIQAAWFRHIDQEFYAIPFKQDTFVDFFDLEGQSLRKAFLKAPLKFSRISSHFSHARLHPILKIYRPHHGVDYAAPGGTPVHTIGDGVIVFLGWDQGGGGNTIKVKHNSNYATAYLHLQGFAKGMSNGKYVKQGEIIGYVGSTGLSTGPHLDFRFYKGGTPINPLKVEAPPVDPIREENMEAYLPVKDSVKAMLDTIPINYPPAKPQHADSTHVPAGES
jgi:murein DD-endopeptidase MepM/ murein hydrolase activator NlpD